MFKLSALNIPLVGKRAISGRVADPAAPGGEKIVSRLAFDAVMVALTSWLLIGLYLDGWAHIHIPDLETFFTPWHGVLYSGFFASAGFLFLTLVRNVWRGYPLTRALPVGYGLSIVGALIFMVGGVADMTWHILFGIEVGVEALLSPTHLILALGGALIVTGPLRAAWQRADDASVETRANDWAARLPMLLSLTILLSVLTFFTQYASPFDETIAGMNHRASTPSEANHFQALGIAGILLQSGLLMGLVLWVVRRWRLPFGSLTLVLTLNGVLMALIHDKFLSTGPYPLIAVAALTGLAGDVLLWQLKPSPTRPAAFRLFAFAVPAILYGLYFSALVLFGGGIWWTIHLWTGAIVLAGVVGWLLSYAFVPPSGSVE